jgi:serine/threonine protein kinase
MFGVSRLCPVCGRRMSEAVCPDDGTATVTAHAWSGGQVRAGDVVAGRYRLQRPIGKGGYASVWAATHQITGQELAVKILKSTFPGPDEATIRRFYREARVTAALTHPSTVRVFDVGQTDGGAFYLAMELLHGLSLEEHLSAKLAEGQVLTESECLAMAIPVLRSLQEAHAQRLVHRDLKPANILLAKVGQETVVKVLDFGIAQTANSTLTTTGMALGTPAYMSPEQCQGFELDGRSDLYSLAIILWRCVTADVPFADANPVDLMHGHLSRPLPDIWKQTRTPLSAGFVAVLHKALTKDLRDRYKDAQAMREALEAIADGALSRTQTEPEPTGQPQRRRRPVMLEAPEALAAFAGDLSKTEPLGTRPAFARPAGPRSEFARTVTPARAAAHSADTLPPGKAPPDAPTQTLPAVALGQEPPPAVPRSSDTAEVARPAASAKSRWRRTLQMGGNQTTVERLPAAADTSITSLLDPD